MSKYSRDRYLKNRDTFIAKALARYYENRVYCIAVQSLWNRKHKEQKTLNDRAYSDRVRNGQEVVLLRS